MKRQVPVTTVQVSDRAPHARLDEAPHLVQRVKLGGLLGDPEVQVATRVNHQPGLIGEHQAKGQHDRGGPVHLLHAAQLHVADHTKSGLDAQDLLLSTMPVAGGRESKGIS